MRACLTHLCQSRESLSARHEQLTPGEGDSLEAGVGTDRVEQMADVVSYGLATQMQLLGDLRGREPAFEEPEHLSLARREVEIGMRLRLLEHVGDLSEDADDVLAVRERDRAHLDGDTVAARVDEHYGLIPRILAPEQLPSKELSRTQALLRSDHRRELTPFDVADETARRVIDPAHDSTRVDQIARDVDVLQGVSDLRFECLQCRGRHQSAPRRSWNTVPPSNLPETTNSLFMELQLVLDEV
jgi:hypothetical protein